MEQRQGFLEFRNRQETETAVVRSEHGREKTMVITKNILEYRQCFDGDWTVWAPVPIEQ